jgi:hypothetical protein
MKNRSRKFLTATAFAAVLATGPSVFDRSAQAQGAGEVMVPKFEVDPFWPKPLPNNWRVAMVIGLSMDAKDNVWIVHRPQTLEQKESYAARGEADCCVAAPDVLEFNPAGNLIRHWGRDEVRGNGHDWPSSNHGITVDKDENVWLGGNGSYQPLPSPGSAAQFAPGAPGTTPSSEKIAREGGGEIGVYHDSFILKFSADGKYLGQIGKANASKGSLDTENVRGVAQIRFLPKTNEIVLADGYGDKRVSVWDAATMKFKRMWGAYGKTPNDDPIPHYDVNSPQFGNPVHCAQPSNDGLIYVCDRTNNRIQVFKTDGTYVKQFALEVNTKGDGALWEIAFSRDPEQKFMYISDGANEKIHVLDRQTLKELYWFGGGGRGPGEFYAVHSVVTDSKGNIYTTETYRGQRVQKFIYQGMVPLSSLLKQHVVGGSIIGQ